MAGDPAQGPASDPLSIAGVDIFEQDLDVIEGAADRLMGFVHNISLANMLPMPLEF